MCGVFGVCGVVREKCRVGWVSVGVGEWVSEWVGWWWWEGEWERESERLFD